MRSDEDLTRPSRQADVDPQGQEAVSLGLQLQGGRCHRRQGFLLQDEAQEELEKARGAILRPAPAVTPSAPPSMTLGEGFTRYFQAKARKKSLPEDQRIAKHLKAELGADTPLVELTAARISEYKDRRLGAKSRQGDDLPSAASINRPLALLRHLLTMAAREWQVIPSAPVIRMEQEPEGRVVWLSEDTEQALLESAKGSRVPDLHAVILLAVETGMRRGEILRLEWANIDMSRGVLTLASRSTKSKRRRLIPMRQAVYDLLAARGERTGQVFRHREWSHYRKAFTALADKIATEPDGEPLTFHGLRHHFASWFMMRGGRPEVLQRILGHQTLAMTARYAHLSPDYLRAEMARTEAPRSKNDQKVLDSAAVHDVSP